MLGSSLSCVNPGNVVESLYERQNLVRSGVASVSVPSFWLLYVHFTEIGIVAPGASNGNDDGRVCENVQTPDTQLICLFSTVTFVEPLNVICDSAMSVKPGGSTYTIVNC